MAMSSTALAAAITNRLYSLWRNEAPSGQDQNENYFLTQLGRIIAEEVVGHIRDNAQCSGIDSGGHSHSNVGIL